MITTDEADQLIGAVAFDRDHDRLGEVRQVFVDTASEEPTWVGVRVGLLGAEVLVPLDGAEWDETELRTTVERGVVRAAPSVDVAEPLTDLDQQRLFRHYGIPSVCTPRSPVDLEAIADLGVCYSVKDADEDVRDDDSLPADVPGADHPVIGGAMQQAASERETTVTGRMLGAVTPA